MGVSPLAGTTQIVGSGLKPRRTGLEKASGSVGRVDDAALRTGSNMMANLVATSHGQISQSDDFGDKVLLLISRYAEVSRCLVVPSTSSVGRWLASRAAFGRRNQESCMSPPTKMTEGRRSDRLCNE